MLSFLRPVCFPTKVPKKQQTEKQPCLKHICQFFFWICCIFTGFCEHTGSKAPHDRFPFSLQNCFLFFSPVKMKTSKKQRPNITKKTNLEWWQNCLWFSIDSIVFHCSFFGFSVVLVGFSLICSYFFWFKIISSVVLCLSLLLFIGFHWCFWCFSSVFVFDSKNRDLNEIQNCLISLPRYSQMNCLIQNEYIEWTLLEL